MPEREYEREREQDREIGECVSKECVLLRVCVCDREIGGERVGRERGGRERDAEIDFNTPRIQNDFSNKSDRGGCISFGCLFVLVFFCSSPSCTQ